MPDAQCPIPNPHPRPVPNQVGSAVTKLKRLTPSPPPGAKPALGRSGSQKGSQRTMARGKSAMFAGALGGLGADGEPADVQAQLREKLVSSGARVVELFREWDVDGDGTVSKAEFVRSLPQLGLQATKEEGSALFDTFDPDGSGTIELKELEKLLRNRVGQLAGTAVMVGPPYCPALLPRPIAPPYCPALLPH